MAKTDIKTLRAPDAFQQAGGKVRDLLIARGGVVIAIVVAAIVVALTVLLYGYFQERTEKKAETELGQDLKVLVRGVGAESAVQDPQSAPFTTDRARDEALVDSLKTFRAARPHTRAAHLAALPLAQAQLRLGKPDDAVTLLKEYLPTVRPDDPFLPLALESQGYALEAKGEYGQALTAFERMNTENKSEFLNGMGLYHRARMLLLLGRKPEAANAFTEVGVLAPGSAAARLAADRAAELAQQGIPASPPPGSAPLAPGSAPGIGGAPRTGFSPGPEALAPASGVVPFAPPSAMARGDGGAVP